VGKGEGIGGGYQFGLKKTVIGLSDGLEETCVETKLRLFRDLKNCLPRETIGREKKKKPKRREATRKSKKRQTRNKHNGREPTCTDHTRAQKEPKRKVNTKAKDQWKSKRPSSV